MYSLVIITNSPRIFIYYNLIKDFSLTIQFRVQFQFHLFTLPVISQNSSDVAGIICYLRFRGINTFCQVSFGSSCLWEIPFLLIFDDFVEKYPTESMLLDAFHEHPLFPSKWFKFLQLTAVKLPLCKYNNSLYIIFVQFIRKYLLIMVISYIVKCGGCVC